MKTISTASNTDGVTSKVNARRTYTTKECRFLICKNQIQPTSTLNSAAIFRQQHKKQILLYCPTVFTVKKDLAEVVVGGTEDIVFAAMPEISIRMANHCWKMNELKGIS